MARKKRTTPKNSSSRSIANRYGKERFADLYDRSLRNNSINRPSRQDLEPYRKISENALRTLAEKYNTSTEEIRVESGKLKFPPFPTIIFTLNLIKDIIDIPSAIIDTTGVGAIPVFLIGSIVFIVNLFYYLGKLNFIKKKMLRMIFGFLIIQLIGLFVPVAEVFVPESLLILAAYSTHNKAVKEFLDEIEGIYKLRGSSKNG